MPADDGLNYDRKEGTMKKKLKLLIWTTTKEGRVLAYVNGKERVYYVDAALIPMIERTAKYQPGKALNMLKKGDRR